MEGCKNKNPKAPGDSETVSKIEKIKSVNLGRIPGHNSHSDSSVESPHGYSGSPQGLKCCLSCKNVWAKKGIHLILQIEESEPHGLYPSCIPMNLA